MSDKGITVDELFKANVTLVCDRADLIAALKKLTGTIDPYSDWNDAGFQEALSHAAATIRRIESRP